MQTPEEQEAGIRLENALKLWFSRPVEQRERALTLLSEFTDGASPEDEELLHAICAMLRSINTLNHV